MVSDPPTRRERARWRASVTLALSAGAIACNTLLDLPSDPYVVEATPVPDPSVVTTTDTPEPSVPLGPEGPGSPELEIDEVQGGSETTGAGGQPDDGSVPGDVGVDAVSDAGVPSDAEPSVLPADAAAVCPPGAALGPSQRCYVALQSTLTGPVAQRSCQALGTGWDLAAIHDAATNDFLNTLIDVEAWIGASDDDTEGEWVWVIDAIPFWSGDSETGVPVNGQFEVWAGGEPNGEDTSDCARFVPNPPRWADFECDSLLASLCEGPPL